MNINPQSRRNITRHANWLQRIINRTNIFQPLLGGILKQTQLIISNFYSHSNSINDLSSSLLYQYSCFQTKFDKKSILVKSVSINLFLHNYIHYLQLGISDDIKVGNNNNIKHHLPLVHKTILNISSSIARNNFKK